MKALKIIGSILLGLAAFFFICAILSNIFLKMNANSTRNPDLQKDYFKNNTGIEVVGFVTDSTVNQGSVRETYTKIKYVVESENREYTTVLPIDSTALTPATAVHVIYNPNNPSDCVVKEANELRYGSEKAQLGYGSKLFVSFFVIMGVCYMIAGIVLFYIRNRIMQRRGLY